MFFFMLLVPAHTPPGCLLALASNFLGVRTVARTLQLIHSDLFPLSDRAEAVKLGDYVHVAWQENINCMPWPLAGA
jgi:hypothetical protein